jgi:hypothetical protein
VPQTQPSGQMLLRATFDAGPLGGVLIAERRLEVQ